jgi:cAMP-dependent protein kinase regulator
MGNAVGCGGTTPRAAAPAPAPGKPTPLKVEGGPTAPVRRRGSAAAQRVEQTGPLNLNALPKVPKDDASKERIAACIGNNVLMKELSPDYKNAVVEAMKEVTAAAGDKVIEQGKLGDFWYVVDKGSLETYKKYDGEEEEKMVKAYSVGDSFGELALMFNQRRAASVVAKEDCILWAVDQATFKAVVMSAAMSNKASYN